MKHPPYIKIFCDKVTVNIYYSMHCVMVIRTTQSLCDGTQDCTDVAVGWAQANRKVGQKSVYFAKRSVSTVRLLQSVRPANSM